MITENAQPKQNCLGTELLVKTLPVKIWRCCRWLLGRAQLESELALKAGAIKHTELWHAELMYRSGPSMYARFIPTSYLTSQLIMKEKYIAYHTLL